MTIDDLRQAIEKVDRHNHILNLVRVHFDSSMLKKAIPIVAKGDLMTYTEDGNKLDFEIKASAESSRIIPLNIEDISKPKIEFKCTCPFSNGGSIPCKHLAAAFLSLLVGDKKDKLFQADFLHHSSAIPFFIPLQKNLFRTIQAYAPQRKSFGIKPKITIENKSAQFAWASVEVFKSYNYKNSVTEKVGFGVFNNVLYTTCSCDEKVEGYCSHQYELLANLAMQNHEFFITKTIGPEDKLDIAKKLNFDHFDDLAPYYVIKLKENKVDISPRDSELSLPLVKPKAREKVLAQLAPKIPESKWVIPAIQEEQEDKKAIVFTVNRALQLTHIDCAFLPNGEQDNYSRLKVMDNFPSFELEKAFSAYKLKLDSLADGSSRAELRKMFRQSILLWISEIKDYPVFVCQIQGSTSKSDFIKVEISNLLADLILLEEQRDRMIYLSNQWKIDGEYYDFKDADIKVYPDFIIKDDVLYFYSDDDVKNLIQEENLEKPVKILENYREEYLEELLPSLLERRTVHKKAEQVYTCTDKEIERWVYLAEENEAIMFRLIVKYDKNELDLLGKENQLWKDYEKGQRIARNLAMEEAFFDFFLSLHPNFTRQRNGRAFMLRPNEMMEKGWFTDFVEKTHKMGIKVLGQKSLKSFKYHLAYPQIDINFTSGLDWFDAEIDVKFDGESVPLSLIKKAIMGKKKFVEIGDGRMGLLPEQWLERLERLFRLGETSNSKVKISMLKFNAIEDLVEESGNEEALGKIREKKEALKSFTKIEKSEIPGELDTALRPYQKEGVYWINFLRKFGFGGILADDMGLGKTLQVITYLAQLKVRGELGLNLIVAPRSLIFNWQNEVQKFYPDLDVWIHHGKDRAESAKHFAEAELVITTYHTLMNDIAWLQGMDFNCLVIDESQYIKNLQSQRNKALRQISAKQRIALTGTPIENSTQDLFAQMQVLNPYLLGDSSSFRKFYSQAIDIDSNPDIAYELTQVVKPFILRRTKEKVAKELPPKTETVLTCEMLPYQRKIYDTYKSQIRSEILGKIDSQGVEKSQMHILTSLLKLRQMCLSTALPKLDQHYDHSSAKIENLVEKLNEMPAGSKALVFSQFVEMLSLIKGSMKEQGIPFAYLDGQTKKREAEITRFQEDPACKVFLISLKAGGTGLNLTAADYVFIMDPWWNPAVESQAIDRAYRIGQKKKVLAYKMICKNSIEEKIIKLQERKKEVAEQIVKSESSLLKSLTKDDIEDLFS